MAKWSKQKQPAPVLSKNFVGVNRPGATSTSWDAPTQDQILEDVDKMVNQINAIGPDCATASETGPAPEPKPAAFIQPGQVWEGVVVPDRPINILSLRVGAVLPPIVIDGPFHDGSGRWSAGFLGERGTKVQVDEGMLRTGKLRP